MPENEITLVDLVRDSKIETRPLDSHVVEHVLYETGRSARRRRVPKTERWTKGRLLGQGTFGTVHLQTCRDGGGSRFRAVKEVKKFVVVGQELDYTRELEAIMKFSNDKYNHCFVSSQGWYELEDAICITMEYFELGDLQQYIDTPLQESEGRQITDQILEGLAFMHENGFIHRDLKPANIMVVDKSPEWFVKIADFGISKRRHHDTSLLTMQRGTLGFAAPEVIGSTSDQSYTYSADMWSLGAMVYRILTSKMAFDSMRDLFKYASGELEFPVGPLESCNISQRGQEFVLMLMESCPGSRGSAASARNHPWAVEPLTPTNGEDFHRAEADHTEMVRYTDMSLPSKAWSSDEELTLLPSRKVETLPKTFSLNRHSTMGQSQDKGRPSNALLPEPYSTVKPEIMNESEIHFEGPVDNAPKRSALKSYPSFERPAWQSSHYVDDHEYPGLDECTDQENSVSIIYPSSSASKPANHQSKLRRAVARLNICNLCKLEPHPDLIEPVPREALSCGHFVCDSCLIQRICLVFTCPVYEIFCCQSIVIDENLLRRLITDPEARSRWQSYWDLGRSLTWTCPEGHIIPRTYVLRTEYGIIMFGEEFIDCGQCSFPSTTYCVFCSRNVVGATRHECAHDLVIMPFIYRLLLKGTFSISWIRCVIDYALRLRHPTIEATKAAYWRSSGPKQKTSTKKNLPSWEFPGSGHYVGPLPDDGRIALQGFIDAVHSRPPPRTQEFQGGQAQKSQAQEMQYRPRVEHSGGNIEASRAYQMRPESHLADESICRYCGSLVPKFNSDGRKIIQCWTCGTNCFTCGQDRYRCSCMPPGSHNTGIFMPWSSSRDRATPAMPRHPPPNEAHYKPRPRHYDRICVFEEIR